MNQEQSNTKRNVLIGTGSAALVGAAALAVALGGGNKPSHNNESDNLRPVTPTPTVTANALPSSSASQTEPKPKPTASLGSPTSIEINPNPSASVSLGDAVHYESTTPAAPKKSTPRPSASETAPKAPDMRLKVGDHPTKLNQGLIIDEQVQLWDRPAHDAGAKPLTARVNKELVNAWQKDGSYCFELDVKDGKAEMACIDPTNTKTQQHTSIKVYHGYGQNPEPSVAWNPSLLTTSTVEVTAVTNGVAYYHNADDPFANPATGLAPIAYSAMPIDQ